MGTEEGGRVRCLSSGRSPTRRGAGGVRGTSHEIEGLRPLGGRLPLDSSAAHLLGWNLPQ